MIWQIRNCYDSHTHFSATGEAALGLQLQSLKSAEDISQLRIQPQHRRAHWITAFGWDQNNWAGQQFPDQKFLDQYFPETPVFFSRVDGHTSWLNSQAYKELVNLGFKSEQSIFNGILQEQDHMKALSLLPSYTDQQQKSFLVIELF